MTARRSLGADAVLASLTAFWGITFTVVKGALDDADPVTFLALRFGVGAAALLLVVRAKVFDRSVLKPATVLGVFLGIGYALQTWGLQYTSPARSAFLTGLCVVMVPFVAMVLFGRRPPWPSFLGALVAGFGLYWFTGAGLSGFGLGEWLTLGCAVAYAIHITLNERFSREKPAGPLVAVQLVLVTVLALLQWPFFEHHLRWSPSFVGALFVSGVLATSVAITLQTWAQARTTAVRAALLFSLEPVFAALYSWLIRREPLAAHEWLGGALIIAGVLLSEVGAAVLPKRVSEI